MEWQPILTAPFDCDLELCIMEAEEFHALVFPCRRTLGGWINAGTGSRVEVRPTHWREWNDEN